MTDAERVHQQALVGAVLRAFTFEQLRLLRLWVHEEERRRREVWDRPKKRGGERG